ncbi:MAG: hypothetical protein NT027_07235 [Proteobacteria bacterium]|nr:hypothetical protein [Pseudomonadota bacterium]
MISALLISLVIADIGLALAFIKLSRRQSQHQAIMREMTEERSLLHELRKSVKEDLAIAQSQVRAMKEQVQILATEAEQEVKSGVTQISAEVDGIVTELGSRFEAPMAELTQKQHYLENLTLRIRNERKSFARVVEKAEYLAKFFQEGVRFDDVMKDLEDKKFSDIRALVTQGVNHTKIARELGVSEQEVKLIAGLR